MQRLPWRAVAVVAVLLLTVFVFVHYFIGHPEVARQLQRTPPRILVLLLALYIGTILALTAVTWATVRLCKISLSPTESLLISCYTAVVNFFGPLQSGPAFRAVYLKARYDLNLKKYATATLMYYFFYGVYSVLMLLYGAFHSWILLLIVLAVISTLLIRRVPVVSRRLSTIDTGGWSALALATFVQVALVTLIYYTELRTVAPGTHFWQALVYSGAANLALFVSITPAAIGFRESFLVFSRNLHHVSGSAIVAASVLDRAMYAVLLLLLAVFIFASHARQRLDVTKH